MKKYIAALVTLISLVAFPAFASAPSVSSPTCTLTVSPVPLELLRSASVTFDWSSTGGTSATLKVDAWSQPNIYSKTGLSGHVTVPVIASLGLEATVTVTRNSPYAVSTCQTQIPTFWIPK